METCRCMPSTCPLSFLRVLYNGKNCFWFSPLSKNISQNKYIVEYATVRVHFAQFSQIHTHSIHLLPPSFLTRTYTDSLTITPPHPPPPPLCFSVPHSLVMSCCEFVLKASLVKLIFRYLMVLFIIIMLVYNYIHISANTTFLKEYKNIQEYTRFEKNCIGGFLVYCSVLLFIYYYIYTTF